VKYAFLLLALPTMAFATQNNTDVTTSIDIKAGTSKLRASAYGETSDAIKGGALAIEGNRLYADTTAFDAVKLGVFGGLAVSEHEDSKKDDYSKVTFSSRSIDLSGGGIVNLELGSRVNLFAKAGLVYSFFDAKRTEISSDVNVSKADDKGFGYTLGAGATFELGKTSPLAPNTAILALILSLKRELSLA